MLIIQIGTEWCTMRTLFDLSPTMIVDGKGDLWAVDDPGLAASLGAALTGEALAQFGVTNLGWTEIRHVGERLHLRCRPQLVSQGTLTGALYVLFARRWRAVALSLLAKSWSYAIFQDCGQVVDLLASLTSKQPARGAGASQRFLRLPVTANFSPLMPVLRSALPIVSDHCLSIENLAAVDRLFKGRWSISHIDPATEQLVFDHMGQGFTRIGPDWAGGVAFAPPPTSISDVAYQQWVARFRLEVAHQTDPVFDVVDAWVNGATQESARLRYHRVTAPISTGGRRLLLSASVVDLAIDLRQAA